MKNTPLELASQIIRGQLDAFRQTNLHLASGASPELGPLIRHQYATQGPLCVDGAGDVSQVVHVRGSEGEIASFRFHLKQSGVGWQMSGITRLNDLKEGSAALLARHFLN
jgi:hypothetical protein